MSLVSYEKKMEVPASALWEVITDFERYPTFLPEVQGTKVVEKRPGTWVVDFEIEVIKKFKYTLVFASTDSAELRWHLKGGELFKKNSGSWILKSLSEGQTQARYELDVEFGFLVPSWVSKKLTESQLPAMIERFEVSAKGKTHG